MSAAHRGSGRSIPSSQLVRYGIAGGLSSVVYSAIFLGLAALLPRSWAAGAVPPAFVAAAALGFMLHRRWSFREPGSVAPVQGRADRFFLFQGGGMVLNTLFTWIITGPLHGPTWLALIPCGTVTPLLTYAIHRRWVFG
ncbi:GtrA family protein [Allosphingosinicella deserti]|uniref:Polysaccharide synthesis protein GtrA n=1 Tax=Allosphingosinicella deserti TaxID=2116704 RepID=A0A2P7QNX2_9SPHN|nr:GtrA family protein [Sphingomonas deserti]PSJ39669.1 polysaccharide synthesis protein GtrA [Sphingomonas deserti]